MVAALAAASAAVAQPYLLRDIRTYAGADSVPSPHPDRVGTVGPRLTFAVAIGPDLLGALSDVEYTITVTDTVTGTPRTYHNPPGEICGGADTEAF